MASRFVESIVGADVPMVILRDKVIKDGIQICPNCSEEIHEKGSYLGEDGNLYHGACGKPYRQPTDPATQEWLANLRKTGKFTADWPFVES